MSDYADNLRKSAINATKRFVKMVEDVREKQNTGWLCPTCGRLPEPTLRPRERAGPYPMLTRDDVIRMAREAGLHLPYWSDEQDPQKDTPSWTMVAPLPPLLGRFAALVADFAAAAEREECAKVCDGWLHADGAQCAAAIRARGEESD